MPNCRHNICQDDWKNLQGTSWLRPVQQPNKDVVLQPEVDLNVPIYTVLIYAGATLDLKYVNQLNIIKGLGALS